MSDSDRPDPPPIVVKFPSPQTLPPHPMSERGARPLAPPPAEQSETRRRSLITPLPRPEPPPAMQTPPPPPMNRDGVVVDHATSGECHFVRQAVGREDATRILPGDAAYRRAGRDLPALHARFGAD